MTNFWKGKKIVVTGASGFIGNAFVNALSQKPCHIIAIISPHVDITRLKKISKKNVVFLAKDLLKESLDELEDVDMLFNFAAFDAGYEFKKSHSADLFDVNIKLSLNVLKSVIQAKIPLLVQMSSIDVYPKSLGREVVEEDALSIEELLPNGYAMAKRTIEQVGHIYSHQFGTKIITVRAANIYGPGDKMQSDRVRAVQSFVNQALTTNKIAIKGNAGFTIPLLYVGDFVDGLIRLIEKTQEPNIYTFANPRPVSLGEVAQAIKKQLPKTEIEISANEQVTITYDTKKLKSVIGEFAKTSLDDGVAETIRYTKKVL